MTQEEIISMAREAGLPTLTEYGYERLQRFAALVAAYEREKQAEQEPVGEMIDKAGYKGAAWYLEPPATGTKLYAAPVRTKDLTDDEIEAIMVEQGDLRTTAFAHAVIAKFKEKNK